MKKKKSKCQKTQKKTAQDIASSTGKQLCYVMSLKRVSIR